MSNVTKLYAAYKAGYLGDNILDTYFSFFATIIKEEHLSVIKEDTITAKFRERYSIELPLPFVRQVLGSGVKYGCFVEDHGQYSVKVEEIMKYCFQTSDFETHWSTLLQEFESYCKTEKIDVSSIDIEDFALSMLDASDDKIIMNELGDQDQALTPLEYSWYSFIRSQAEANTDLYTFISAISASNITKQALFFEGDNQADYSGLHIYLDSPIVFALLGMDDPSRTDSYKVLVQDMIKAHCDVHVLDHNFQEVDSIIARAATWATDTQYDLRRANNAARFFHDSLMSESEIAEFCGSIEEKLNELGITIAPTEYDVYQNEFQEDETVLFDMVKERYQERGYNLSPDKERSIRIDVRSIVMVYRERRGHTATKLQEARHLMLTSNNAIANVSKKYESNKSLNSGHIPTCISADLFGAILWLNSPTQMIEYQKKKLLADCYASLRPDKTLLDKYIQSLDEARAADRIDEKKYLFLRTHKVVLDSLMNITKGDYARFNSNTYLEVFDDIQARANKKYEDEANEHKATRQALINAIGKAEDEKQQSAKTIRQLTERIASLEQKEAQRLEEEKEAKVNRLGWIYTFLFVGIPYVLLLAALELFKAQFSQLTWGNALRIVIAVVLTFVFALLFKKGKACCFKKAKNRVEIKTKE